MGGMPFDPAVMDPAFFGLLPDLSHLRTMRCGYAAVWEAHTAMLLSAARAWGHATRRAHKDAGAELPRSIWRQWRYGWLQSAYGFDSDTSYSAFASARDIVHYIQAVVWASDVNVPALYTHARAVPHLVEVDLSPGAKNQIDANGRVPRTSACLHLGLDEVAELGGVGLDALLPFVARRWAIPHHPAKTAALLADPGGDQPLLGWLLEDEPLTGDSIALLQRLSEYTPPAASNTFGASADFSLSLIDRLWRAMRVYQLRRGGCPVLPDRVAPSHPDFLDRSLDVASWWIDQSVSLGHIEGARRPTRALWAGSDDQVPFDEPVPAGVPLSYSFSAWYDSARAAVTVSHPIAADWPAGQVFVQTPAPGIGLVTSLPRPPGSGSAPAEAAVMLPQVGAAGTGDGPRPTWDRPGRVLTVGGTTVRRFERLSKNQEAILDAFQAAHWAAVVEQVPGLSGKTLGDAIDDLNASLSPPLINFRRNGDGRGVRWAYGAVPLNRR